VLGQDEILSRLNVEPFEAELVKAVGRQLEALDGVRGLIKYTGRKWRWRG